MLDTELARQHDQRMFGIGPFESAALLLWALGVAAALIAHAQGWTSTRQFSVALAAALLLPVVGSLIAIAIVVVARYSARRPAATL